MRLAVEKASTISPLPCSVTAPVRARPLWARRATRDSCREDSGASVARTMMHEPLASSGSAASFFPILSPAIVRSMSEPKFVIANAPSV